MKMKFRKSKIILSATVILILIGLLTFKKYSAYAQNVSIPKNPKIISQSITNEKATLIWEKPDKYDNIKNYNIYQDGQKIGDANSGSTIAKEYFDRFYNDASNSNAVKISAHNYTVKNLKPNTEYHFTIRSIDNEGKESQDSQTVNLKTDDTLKIFNIEDFGTKPAILDYAENCTFKDVKFDDSIINPWEITNSTGLKFEGTTKVNK